MKQSIVISVLGDDKPGLVESLSQLIVEHQGEWVESRMASLAGKFAGILSVSLPKENIESFKTALQNSEKLCLKVMFEDSLASNHGIASKTYHIELLGQDQPGIIHKISSVLARLNASVDELYTEVVEASMSGEQLFKANIELQVPADVSAALIQQELEHLANELIVDIALQPSEN
ncbi:glycine cleavage system protein R [Thiomicrorhabdus sediminis]|uniref:Glycine cleavage system transcriptional repressor n=1 Tax=Thiomicrorhabdus sediminis TaxID=2580412 RepID=A0A4P9K6K5_9GAMM|nr:ACT domain-containing protein [Thiomicrorhabdus sediminis]QCU89867.1 glycine cleavage system protein R [Thiomicrorhabdus sediminis]